MAKKTVSKSTLNIELLNGIASGAVGFISQADGLPLLGYNPPLIEVNTSMLDPTDNTKAAVRITEAGKQYVAANSGSGSNAAAPAGGSTSPYDIVTNAVLPASKRGNKGGGAPTQYPFDKLEVGNTFFVPISEKHPNPVKTLGSTVSSANARFSQPTGETKQVNRTKRGEGNKAVKDAAGNNVKEMVTVQVKKPLRKFTIRGVVKGQTYGEWIAPSDGALIGRIL